MTVTDWFLSVSFPDTLVLTFLVVMAGIGLRFGAYIAEWMMGEFDKDSDV